MRQPPKEWLAFLRQQYPQGSRVRLREMGADEPRPLAPGSMGTLEHIDDLGTFHVKWANGRSLGLVVGQDNFAVLPPAPEILKLYMPLTVELYELDEYGDMRDDPLILGGYDLVKYADSIHAALLKNRIPEEAERGLMRWYHEADTVNDKVRSVLFTAEVRDRQLWGVAECQLTEPLTPEEMATLTEYIAGQASDGWGEGFEQREIPVNGAELYVHLWGSDSWSLMAEKDRFDPTFAQRLPEMCWSVDQADGSLVYVKKGAVGCFPSEWGTHDAVRNHRLAEYHNKKRGITAAQVQAMISGALFGWDDPRADPRQQSMAQAKQSEVAGQDVRKEQERQRAQVVTEASCPQDEMGDPRPVTKMEGMSLS